jgi:TRAP-type uncharacterized transport system substrate-binding protein
MSPASIARVFRRRNLQLVLLALLAVAAAVWIAFQVLQPLPPRTIVIASGVEEGLYHRHAQRYVTWLREHGVRVVERKTSGAAENYRLLLDPKSKVDVAFMQGGVATLPEADRLVMLASLYVEPLWLFYRADGALARATSLVGARISIGIPGSGTRAFVAPLLTANGVTTENSTLLETGGKEALRQLKAGEIDAALFVGGADSPLIREALFDPAIKLMSLGRADAYARRYGYISRLTLPAGTIDLARNLPPSDVATIGTKAMLAARDDLHPAIINLLIDAAREIHGGQGVFETAGEFPGTARVDLPVSPYADQHRRFGPSFLYQAMPFWAAALVERLIVLLLPLLFLVVPLMNLLPRVVRWRDRSRLVRWYGQLALLERDVATRQGDAPVEKWLQELAEISRAVGQRRMPPAFASEVFTLREHIDLVRREILAKR